MEVSLEPTRRLRNVVDVRQVCERNHGSSRVQFRLGVLLRQRFARFHE